MEIYIEKLNPGKVIIKSKFLYKFINFIQNIGLKRKYNDESILIARKLLNKPDFRKYEPDWYIKILEEAAQCRLTGEKRS